MVSEVFVGAWVRRRGGEKVGGGKGVRNEWHLKVVTTCGSRCYGLKRPRLPNWCSSQSTTGKEANMDGAFRRAVAEARRHRDLYFASLLSEDRILQAFGAARALWQGWIYTPAVTVWVFLSQCLSSDHSCRETVARLIAWRLAQGLRPCSAETGAYCTAREDLPEATCYQLVRDTGREVEPAMPRDWLWRGRRVLDV